MVYVDSNNFQHTFFKNALQKILLKSSDFQNEKNKPADTSEMNLDKNGMRPIEKMLGYGIESASHNLRKRVKFRYLG